ASRDACDVLSAPSNMARSILLQLDDSTGAARLTWNTYEGWGGGVDHFEVEMRELTSNQWQSLGILPQSQFGFRDQNENTGSAGRCYRVWAYESGGLNARSVSNEVCAGQELWVPNVLTPNGDGANDLFEIPGLAAYPGATLQVFNRWGNLIFEAAQYDNRWDGSHIKTGEALPDGAYYYLLQLGEGGQLRKGHVTIMR
ncbi:MAG: gliding motility-associated C-terminal domain-containing protein, partial [Bacteroidota bacterium]